MAEYFFRKYHSGHDVKSAGTDVIEQGDVVPMNVWMALNERGIDAKHHRTMQLTPKIYESVDEMILLSGANTCPSYASAECWDIPDPRNEEEIRVVRDTIEEKIRLMIFDYTK